MAEEAAATVVQDDEQNTGAAEGQKDAASAGTTEQVDVELGEAGQKALDAFKQRARDAEKQAKALAAKVKEFEDRDKSEQDKLEERATTAETKAQAAEAKVLRFEVATAKKLPLELADRLQGASKADLEADADRLLELVKPNGKPEGDADAGKGEGGGGMGFNEAIRAQIRR
jgi:hypothetical protein